jgi:SET domain-containing protein
MIRFKTEVRPSEIQGEGLFALENISKRDIVWYFGYDDGDIIISEEEYLQKRITGDKIFQRTACRWIDDKFMYCENWGLDVYLNHSFDPNVLYYCGLGIAKRDILVGEEITLNFQYMLSENDTVKFIDKSSGDEVCGLSTQEILLRTSKELYELL